MAVLAKRTAHSGGPDSTKGEPSPSPNTRSSTPAGSSNPVKQSSYPRAEYEFGGPWGALGLIIFSHAVLYYVYYILHHNNGYLWWPASVEEAQVALAHLGETASPTWTGAGLYFGYLGLEMVFAYIMPGVELLGRKDETGRRLMYNCNAYLSWWATLALIAIAHVSGYFHMSAYIDYAGSVMTVAVLFANVQSLYWYLYAFATNQTHRMTGNHVYDFFMGAILHPRIGSLDVKMFAEIRVSWFLLFILTFSAAAKQLEETGKVSSSMAFMVLAHFLYTNACAKGEHFVPPTFDITYEKYGWYLCFWNFAGVPFLYCKSAVYLLKHTPSVNLPPLFVLALTFALLFAYYVWDTSQSQKNHFRLKYAGTLIERRTFPYLLWQTLGDDATYIKTEAGTPLLTDGWWRYARKIHYTCDIVMGTTWALCTGFDAFIPYFYPFFFTTMIIHRYFRDMEKCAKVYGKDWDRYLATVPYSFIPGVI